MARLGMQNRLRTRNICYLSLVGILISVSVLWILVIGQMPAWSFCRLYRPNFIESTLNSKSTDSVALSDSGPGQWQGRFSSSGLASSDNNNTFQSHAVNVTIERLKVRVAKRLANCSFYRLRLNETVYNSAADTNRSYVSHVIYHGGLGNWMFMIGSLYGVSRVNSRIPSLLQDYWAEKAFENFYMEKRNRSALIGNDSQKAFDDAKLGEVDAGKFTPAMTNITATKGHRNVLLKGYLQSWKYFDLYRDEIRSLFTFSKTTYVVSLLTVQTALKRHFNITDLVLPESDQMLASMPVLVGIHVRRGDIITSSEQQKVGHRPASEEYLLRAALRFQRARASVVFIVVSNDIAYCKTVYTEPNFLFLENTSESVGMAVLSLMDHIILSVGTYGWWGAYLSDAQDIYYFKDWPKNGSHLETKYNKLEYFLPTWIPFS